MGLNKMVGTFSNAGSPTAAGHFGPYSLPTIIKLLSAKVIISTVPTIQQWTSSTTLVSAAAIGMQVVFTGDPPFNVPGDTGLTNFLDHLPQTDDDSFMAWSPNTATADVVVKSSRTLRYAGQKYFGASLDFYVSWGSTYTSDPAQYAGQYELIYTT
jgi:hypothetical protein